MQTKSFGVRVKAVGTTDGLDSDGEFEAIVAAWNADTYGDRIVKGAFADDLQRWADSGDPIPVVWSHRWEDPFSHVGRVLAAEERDEGLWVHAVIDDLDTNPTAAQVHRLLKGRRITQFSFAFDVIEGGPAKSEEDGDAYELRKLKTYEVGPCLVGVNQETELLAAKAEAMVKAGRVLSQSNYDLLVEARGSLDAVIKAAEPEKAAEPKTSDPSGSEKTDELSQPESDAEEPAGAKADAKGPRQRVVDALALLNSPKENV